jgi:hypothetical protein
LGAEFVVGKCFWGKVYGIGEKYFGKVEFFDGKSYKR